MNQEPDLTRVLDDMAGRARTDHMPDPLTLRRTADRRHRRRLAMVAACVAALVAVPLTVAVARQDQAAPAPTSPSGVECLAPAHGPKPSHWEGDTRRAVPSEPGWVETFPAVASHHKVEFNSVAANETGYLVVGRTYAGNFGPTFHDNQWRAWFSTNGRTWTTSLLPTGVGHSLLAMEGVFYASGFAEDGMPALWVTTNGRDWRSTTIVHISQNLQLPVGKIVDLDSLSCVAGQLVAYGTDHNTKAGWGSEDGRHWSRLDPNGPVLHDLSSFDQPSLAGDGPAGTVAIPPWGDGWVPGRIWFHRS